MNERLALQMDAVKRAFAAGNVVLMRADWTSRDAEITQRLATLGRSSVPVYVRYPSAATAKGEILPAVLTPGQVVEAVTRATAGRMNAGD